MSSCGRVVKALDLKSNGLCPRRFEPCQLRQPFYEQPKACAPTFSLSSFCDNKKMPPMGIEPMTPGLRDQCSTTELKRQLHSCSYSCVHANYVLM